MDRETSNRESQISNLKSDISGSKSEISNRKSQISDKADSAPPPSEFPKWRLIVLLIAAVLAWGIFHAIGAYRFNHDPRRALMVLACVLGFLAFWGLLLWNR